MADNTLTDDQVNSLNNIGPDKLYELLNGKPTSSDDMPYGTTQDTLYGTSQPIKQTSSDPISTATISPSGSLPGSISAKYAGLQTEGRIGNPSSETEDSEDDEDSSPSVSSIVNGANAAQQMAPGQNKDYLHDLISKIYGKDLGDDALKAAQAKRDHGQLTSNLLRSGNIISSALAAGQGGTIKPDETMPDQLEKEAGNSITDIAQRRQAKLQDLESGLKATDLIDKEQLRDPMSKVSEAYREQAVALNPKLGDVPNFDQMNAEGIKQLMPMIDLSIKSQVAKDNHELAHMQKQEQTWNKAEQDFGNKVSQFDSPRGAGGRAAIVNQAADRLDALSKQIQRNGQVTQNDYNLAIADVATIMKGGTATEGSMKEMMNPTLRSKIGSIQQFFTNTPADIQAGDFVNHLQDLTHEVNKTAVKYRFDGKQDLLSKYKNSLRPESFEKYSNDLDDQRANALGGSATTSTQSKGNVNSDTLKAYAAQHQLNEDNAASMLKAGGYSVEGY